MKEPKHRPQRSSAHRQRGVAAVISAIAVVALFASLALAIDVGQLYYAQRDLEKQASLAAIAGAQAASGCRGTAGVPAGLTGAQSAAATSIGLNPASALSGTSAPGSTVEVGWVNDSANQVLMGVVNKTQQIAIAPSDGSRRFFALSSVDPNVSPSINAARITLTRPQPTPLIPFISGGGVGGGMLSASAVAEQQALGSFNIGTTLATVNTASSPLLGGLLCGTNTGCLAGVNISAAGFQGLLNTSVSLGQIAAAVGVTDLSNLLTTSTTLPTILNGLSPLISGATSGTGSLISGVLGAANSGVVNLGDIFGNTTGVAPGAPVINLLDLITALAADATKNSSGGSAIIPINLPVGVNLAGVGTVNTFLKVGAPPQPGGLAPAGVAMAHTAEITLLVRIQASAVVSSLSSAIKSALNSILGGLLSVLNLLGVSVSTPTIPSPLNIGVDVAVAPASATLNTLACPDMSNGSPVAALSAITSIATVTVGTFSSSALTAPVTPVSSLPIATITINATSLGLGSTTDVLSLNFSSVGVGSTGSSALPLKVTMFHPVVQEAGDPLTSLTYVASGFAEPAVADNPQTVGSQVNLALSANVNVTQTGGSGLTGVLSGVVTSLVSNLTSGILSTLISGINSLASQVINPLLSLLGVQAGAATVTMASVVTGAPVVVITSKVPGP